MAEREKPANAAKSKPKKSVYIETLSGEALARYKKKLELIDGVDPYQINKKYWSSDEEKLPAISYPDLLSYLLFTPSPYSKEDLKAIKSTESYNQFLNGFVREVNVFTVQQNDKIPDEDQICCVTSRVQHSQRLSETALQSWAICKQNGEIMACHCNCLAGLDEACAHVAAMLITIEATVRIRDAQTVTQKKAYWMLPPALREVPYKPVCEIDFTAPKTKQKEFNKALETLSANVNEQIQVKKMKTLRTKEIDVPSPTEDELSALFSQLSESKSKPAILSIVEPFSKNYQPRTVELDLPLILTTLVDKDAQSMNYSDLLRHCENIDVSVTENQVRVAENQTRDQSENKLWFDVKSGRIGASKIKSACSTNPSLPSQSLIKSICYPELTKFTSDATSWGCSHEKTARDFYKSVMNKQHTDFIVYDSGFQIMQDKPFIGASPDGIVNCRCCGEGTLEIKCPFCHMNDSIEKAISTDKSFCIEKAGDIYTLKKSHQYYYQVQTQISVCQQDYGDFVVWTSEGVFIERILPDPDFFKSLVEKAERFFKLCIMPELVGKFYSRLPAGDINNGNKADQSTEPVYCYCRCPSYGEMVGCDNPTCTMEWFHFDCLKLDSEPKTKKWYCPDCSKLPEFCKKWKKDI